MAEDGRGTGPAPASGAGGLDRHPRPAGRPAARAVALWDTALRVDLDLRGVRAWWHNTYQIHQRLLMAWPDRQAGRILWRRAPEPGLLRVRSATPGDWDRAFHDFPALRQAASHPTPLPDVARVTWWFRLRANPTRINSRTRRRIPLDPPQWGDWLRGKLEPQRLVEVVAVPEPTIEIPARGDRYALTFVPVAYEGRFEVTDPALLRPVLADGVGPGKSFGLGMLCCEARYSGTL